MMIAKNIVIALIIIASTYVFISSYKNDTKKFELNMDSLKLDKFKSFYLFLNIVVALSLILILNLVYNSPLLSQIKLITLVLIMIPIAVIDYEYMKIPNILILFGLSLRVVIFIFEFIYANDTAIYVLKNSLIAAGLVSIFFLVLSFVFKNSIGMGDIKLFAIMGLYQGLTGVLNSIFFSLLVSFIISIFLLITKKKKRNDHIPFGPSILIGTIIAIVLLGV